jgi:hypothetical protein
LIYFKFLNGMTEKYLRVLGLEEQEEQKWIGDFNKALAGAEVRRQIAPRLSYFLGRKLVGAGGWRGRKTTHAVLKMGRWPEAEIARIGGVILARGGIEGTMTVEKREREQGLLISDGGGGGGFALKPFYNPKTGDRNLYPPLAYLGLLSWVLRDGQILNRIGHERATLVVLSPARRSALS